MAKRVRAAEPLGVRINETELEILRLLSRLAGTRVVAVKAICSEVCRSEPTVRNSVRHLSEQGLVEPRRRFLANGGQLENEYEVTELGRRVLDVASVS